MNSTNRVSAHTAIAVMVVAGLMVIGLSGCLEPTAEPTSMADAQALADSLVYVKAKNGLCFGVGTTSRWSTNANIAYSNQVVHVPCAAVGLH